MTILVLIRTVFVIIWGIFHGRISLNSVLLLLLVNFMSGFRLELMYISVIVNIRSKPHSSPWFSAACVIAIVHRNHFFLCTNRIKFWIKSKDRLAIAAKGCVKLLNLHMLIKQKSPSLARNLAFGTFDESLTVFSANINLLYLFHLTILRCCLLHLKNSNLDDPVSLILKLHNISVTPKMVKNVKTNLKSPKASGPNCIPVVVPKNCESELS